MASSKYTIYVKNHSHDNQKYMFFNAAPSDIGPLGTVYSNVWVKTGGTPTPNGQQFLTVTMDNFAVCGNSDGPLASGVSVSMTDWTQVSLNNSSLPGTEAVVGIVNDNPSFLQPPGTCSTPNSFEIKVNAFDPDRFPNAYVSYGKHDTNNNVVPVLSWKAEPAKVYKVTPNVRFYISTGSYQQGDAVDITTLGSVATIDFTTAPVGMTKATVTHNLDNTYSDPVFEFPAKN